MANARSVKPKVEYLVEPGKQELRMSCELDAPPELVFRAFTDPKLFARWWGPRQYENHIEKYEARPGGSWRVVQRAKDGGEHPFRGVFHDVVKPERIVQTFEYEGVPGHVALQTATFEPLGNRTRVVTQTVFQSVADRDGMIASGMRQGSDESMERLGELIEELNSKSGAQASAS